MTIGLALYAVLLMLATAACTQQASAPPEIHDDAAALREEIQTIEKLLPRLPDRGPALFELAHDYASLGDLRRSLTFLQECASLHQGFNPEGDPAFARLKDDPEFKTLVAQVRREFPQVQRARLAFTVPSPILYPRAWPSIPNSISSTWEA